MNERDIQFRLGVGAMVASALFIFIAIPSLVSSPSNVRNIILSPLFWPYVLAGFTALIGLGLLATALRTPTTTGKPKSDVSNRAAAYLRLLGIAAIMLLTAFAMPKVGLVWTTMMVFAATAFLVRTSHPKTALISAVVVPLALYLFFAHVAGVAIPQGELVRLP